MPNILILYPKLFNSFTKFSRKVNNIISSLNGVVLVSQIDYNGFLLKIHEENPEKIHSIKLFNWKIENITHAIIFDDGEEFIQEVEKLRYCNIPLRIISISITRVVNLKKEPQFKAEEGTPSYEYIGRGSYWGNPHSMYEEGDSREEVIRKYKYDFDFEKFPNKEKSEVYKLAGKRLGCFCKPEACHGDILADFLNSWDDGK